MCKVPFPRVKVCGITLEADAEALDTLGIDYLGFNFSPNSKRYVEPKAAARMIARLKHAEPVGVFVDSPPDQIHSIASETGIRWVQLHGQEGWDTIEKICLPIIKAISDIRLHDYGSLKVEWNERASKPVFFLIDTHSDSNFGGSGKTFDWSKLNENPLPLPYFLAGGIGPENLKKAVQTTQPYAVDLNSRVELEPGVKNIKLIENCLIQLKAEF